MVGLQHISQLLVRRIAAERYSMQSLHDVNHNVAALTNCNNPLITNTAASFRLYGLQGLKASQRVVHGAPRRLCPTLHAPWAVLAG